MQVSSGESAHVILVRGLKVSVLQILKASFLRSKCAVGVQCLFGICSGKKKSTHQMTVSFKHQPLCVNNRQQIALSVLVSGSRYPQAFSLKPVPLLY